MKLQEITKEAERAIEEELEKLSSLEKNSPEFNGTKSYLDWLTQLPWGHASVDNFDLKKAKEGLDEVRIYLSKRRFVANIFVLFPVINFSHVIPNIWYFFYGSKVGGVPNSAVYLGVFFCLPFHSQILSMPLPQ